DVFQRPVELVTVRCAPNEQFGLRRQVVRAASRMHPRLEAVQDPDLVTLGEECVNGMGADNAGPAGDEHPPEATHRPVPCARASTVAPRIFTSSQSDQEST